MYVWEYTYTYIPTHITIYVYIIVPYCESLKNYVRHTVGCGNKRSEIGRRNRESISPPKKCTRKPYKHIYNTIYRNGYVKNKEFFSICNWLNTWMRRAVIQSNKLYQILNCMGVGVQTPCCSKIYCTQSAFLPYCPVLFILQIVFY